MATRKKKEPVVDTNWPKITQGSHLTVVTYESGHTELKWDDNALTAEVEAAIISVQTPVKKSRKNPLSKEKHCAQLV
jgi:hypothetical protein